LERVTTHPVLAADAAIDLQMHTLYSDGVWTPEALIDYLVSEQFGLAAITDHDRVDTVAALQQLGAEKHLPVLAAVEISASWRGEPTDLLCYGFDPAKNELGAVAQDVARRQTENTREVFENLQRKGVSFATSQESVEKVGGALSEPELVALLEEPSAQQPHALVALLKKHGYGTEAISPGQMITDAGFSWATIDIAAVVDAAHRSGAVCLIAHPGRGEGYVRYDVALLDQLRQDVPIDGFEVYYPAHTPEQIAMYLEYAQKYHLLTSSGSDSHGPDNKPIKYKAALSRSLLERLGIHVS
jgi:3',5'-nucleoside bisphosphate phosphatase